LREKKPGLLQETISTVRVAITETFHVCMLGFSDLVASGQSNLNGALDVLQSEDNDLLRAGVIGGAALVGLGFGSVRGGRIRRMTYTLLAGAGGSVICFPQLGLRLAEGSKETFNSLTNGNLHDIELTLPVLDPAVLVGGFVSGVKKLLMDMREAGSVALTAAKNLSQEKTIPVPEGKEDENQTDSKHKDVRQNTSKETSVVFIPEKSLVASQPVEGDPGMGTEEDSDLYTTRG